MRRGEVQRVSAARSWEEQERWFPFSEADLASLAVLPGPPANSWGPGALRVAQEV